MWISFTNVFFAFGLFVISSPNDLNRPTQETTRLNRYDQYDQENDMDEGENKVEDDNEVSRVDDDDDDKNSRQNRWERSPLNVKDSSNKKLQQEAAWSDWTPCDADGIFL